MMFVAIKNICKAYYLGCWKGLFMKAILKVLYIVFSLFCNKSESGLRYTFDVYAIFSSQMLFYKVLILSLKLCSKDFQTLLPLLHKIKFESWRWRRSRLYYIIVAWSQHTCFFHLVAKYRKIKFYRKTESPVSQ